ncbi:MAG: universal stress protein [Actinomycetota bacterium]
MTPKQPGGPVIVGYDGSPASECALTDAAPILAIRRALVVVVWEAGAAFELVAIPPDLVPAPIDIRAALQLEDKLYEAARRLAEHGAGLARCAGLEAEALAVADEVTPAATLVRLARERDAPAVVVGTRGHRGLTHALLGSTAEEVMRQAPCPVVVRGPGGTGHRRTSAAPASQEER